MINHFYSLSCPDKNLLNTLKRFLLSGATNTVLTYILYIGLIQIMPYTTGYTIAFITGIVLAYLLNRFFVFREKGKFGKILLFPIIYIVQYLLSIAIINYWVEILNNDELFAPIIACMIVIPLNFICSRFLFVNQKSVEIK